MPYCPSCYSEYRRGYSDCASCKVPLVEKLEDALEMGEAEQATYFQDKSVVMVTQGGIATVLEVRDILETGGCPCRIRPVEGSDDMPPVAQLFRLDIVDTDLDKARAILGNRWKESLAKEGVTAAATEKEAVLADGSETECPACSTRFTPKDTKSAECPECGLFLGVPG
ncbi:MAG: hypothetical protein HY904_25425 [Deltaproteobacteria bacterium]|nr:hypothetical protein [Deltaproteobacteria bacterium]